MGGINGEWTIASNVPMQALLLYLHGGGYVACSPQSHRAVTGAFALAGFKTFAARSDAISQQQACDLSQGEVLSNSQMGEPNILSI